MAWPAFAQEKEQKASEPVADKQSKPAASPPATPQQNGLKRLEEDLFKPLKTFSPNSSLDGVFVTPPKALPPRPADTKKAQEKLDREKNWIFLTPEELLATPSTDEIFNVNSGAKNDQKQKLSAFERYYRRTFHLDNQADTDTTDGAADRKKRKDANKLFDSLRSDEPEEADDSHLPTGLRDTQRILKSVSSDKTKDRPAPVNGGFLSDIFGLGKALPTPAELEQKRQEKERMDEFKKLLGIAAPATADSLNPLAGISNPAKTPAISIDPVPTVSSSKLNSSAPAQVGAIGGFSSPLSSPFNGSASAASGSSFLNPAPVIEQPKPVVANPTFSAPRRSF